MISFSFTNPTKEECLLGILTDNEITVFEGNNDSDMVEYTKQLISIGLVIFRIDILL